MDLTDIVLQFDQKFSGDGAVACPNEGKPIKHGNARVYTEHGTLSVHKSGAFLVCGRCNYQQPVSQP